MPGAWPHSLNSPQPPPPRHRRKHCSGAAYCRVPALCPAALAPLLAPPLLLPAASSVPGACILDGQWLQHLLTTVVRAVITRPQAFPSFRAQFNAVKWGDAAGLRDVLVQFQRALLEHEQETGQVGGVLPVCLCACLGWLCVLTQLPRVPYGCTAHAVRYRANTASNGDDSEGHCGRHVPGAGTRQPVCRPGVLHAPSHTHDG